VTDRLLFAGALLRRLPPWLQRKVGARVVQGMADPLDALVVSSVAAVKARFPSAALPTALPYIGSERRIRRGPFEAASTYARRLLTWWTDHRSRGGPYALLRMLDAYYHDFLNVRMDVVGNTGIRHWIDAPASIAASVITRDVISWGGDGTGLWARVWVVLYVPALIPIEAGFLVDDLGEPILDDLGNPIESVVSVSPGALTAAQAELFAVVPREWSAAHIDQTNVVLLWGTRRLWDYPVPVPTWDEWEASGALWGDEPTVITLEA